MGKINYGRVFLGGLVAALVIFVIEAIAGAFYHGQMEAEMLQLGLSMQMGAGVMIQILLACLLIGFVSIFFYAGVRPRFGPGPGTAACVGIALFFGSYVPTLLGYSMLGLFSTSLLVIWGVIGLVEMIVATILGAWLYKEEVPLPSGQP